MKDQVIMSPNNGALCIAIPLFQKLTLKMKSYDATISTYEYVPIAYAIDCGPEVDEIHFFSALWVEKHFIFLGDL